MIPGNTTGGHPPIPPVGRSRHDSPRPYVRCKVSRQFPILEENLMKVMSRLVFRPYDVDSEILAENSGKEKK